jgi:glycosyltransferase involved in cell wall biosynthesis
MRIAQIAPLAESVPPKFYGGTERIVSYLTEELVGLGHGVTLFASGDSVTSAELVSCADIALRLNPMVKDHLPYHMLMLDEVRRRVDEFDVIHFHIDLLHFPLIKYWSAQTVTTLHGRLDLLDLAPFYSAFSDVPLVSVSDGQRWPMPPVNWLRTVYHGLPANLLPYCAEPEGNYLAFLGRISPEKRPDRAIEIAARAGIPLRIAAKVDRVDQEYWEDVIQPMIRKHPNVEYLGEIDDREKADFLGNAMALLFPIDWPEPFGLVMIEAMSCGTPTIAFRCGSVPEVIDDGRSGLIVANIDEGVAAVDVAAGLSRADVRAVFEQRFTAERMARDYVEVYRSLDITASNASRLRPLTNLDEGLQSVA